MTSQQFGIVHTGSTSTTINILAFNEEQLVGIVGRQVYIEVEVSGATYKAIGLITDIKTVNNQLDNSSYNVMAARGGEMKVVGVDLRMGTFKLQAVFRFNETTGMWEQAGASLPTSPSTSKPVYLLDEEDLDGFVTDDLPAIGYLRGMPNTPARLNLTDFSGSRGATHAAVLGRSGSGKSQAYALTLAAYMRNEQHAIIIVDPQGQWSKEQGMIFSPQRFAKALGRNVHVLRVAEDIALPLDEDIFSAILVKLNVWKKGFKRMGAENELILSDIVVTKIIKRAKDDKSYLSKGPREILTRVFSDIASSDSTLNRIYASGGDARAGLYRTLSLLAGLPIYNEDGEQEIIEQDELDSTEELWESLVTYFTPLLNLFAKKNLSGGKRRSLGGEKGFLSSVLQIRNDQSAPAPYVVLDMSPDTTMHAKHLALGGADPNIAMKKMLDNQDIKALILKAVFLEVKKASEIAFENGGGNLNTQIVFDEAWRYAPEQSHSAEISDLADMLEGYALDTRKFGIGWTYILQTPADLRTGIWRQLTFVYSGYGLIGDDLRRLGGLMDDASMLDFYKQFTPPGSSHIYPFMITGSLSPLIFTNSPTFVNAFDGDEFMEHNQVWINNITQKRGLPKITSDYLKTAKLPSQKVNIIPKNSTSVKTYKVGGDTENTKIQASTPQVIKKQEPQVTEIKPEPVDEDDFPF